METIKTIKAIETSYQGCLFRSRLEARLITTKIIFTTPFASCYSGGYGTET